MAMKKWGFLMAAAVSLALVLMGCPTETTEGEKPCEDGAIPASRLPTKEFAETTNKSEGENITYVAVPAGSTYGTEVTAGKWSKGEIRYAEWYAVMQEWGIPNASYKLANNGANGAGVDSDERVGWNGPAFGPYPSNPYSSNWKNYPVVGINLRDAIVFCNALSEALGKEPVYLCEHGNILKDANTPVERLVDVSKMAGKNGYRLPTVDEYIYASQKLIAKTGLQSTGGQNWWGGYVKVTNIGDAEDGMNNNGSENGINGYGLAWMSGNAWKWCFTNNTTFGVMGGDMWESRADTLKNYDWTVRKVGEPPAPVPAEDPGSRNKYNGPSYSLRIRTNLAE